MVVQKELYYSELADQKVAAIPILKDHLAWEADLGVVYINGSDNRLVGTLPQVRVWPVGQGL